MSTLSRTGARLLTPALAASLLVFAPAGPAQASPDRVQPGRIFEPQGPAPAPLRSAEVQAQETAERRRPEPRPAAEPKQAPAPAQATASEQATGSSIGERALAVAKGRAGSPYVYGASGPGAFDCSGLVQWSFAQIGKSMPRTSGAQAGATERVSEPRVGDLVFFTSGGSVYHVGFYAGDHTIWHAPRPGAAVRQEAIWSSSIFYGRVN